MKKITGYLLIILAVLALIFCLYTALVYTVEVPTFSIMRVVFYTLMVPMLIAGFTLIKR